MDVYTIVHKLVIVKKMAEREILIKREVMYLVAGYSSLNL